MAAAEKYWIKPAPNESIAYSMIRTAHTYLCVVVVVAAAAFFYVWYYVMLFVSHEDKTRRKKNY